MLDNSLHNSRLYVGYSNDNDVRYRASSGGIGTVVSKLLLASPNYGTTITFKYNKEKTCYEPLLVYSPEHINICGSIYQDIDIYKFIKQNMLRIKDGIVLTCPPCQVASIRKLLNDNNIRNFIISYCCSGQTTLEGTWKYLQLIGVNKQDVEHLQYRGNGWPSGIQIQLLNGKKIYKDNWTMPWSLLQESKLYRPKRCFYCKFETSYASDISLADPWVKEYMKTDKIGSSLIIVNTEEASHLLEKLDTTKIISISPFSEQAFKTAQKANVEKKVDVSKHKIAIKKLIKLIDNKSYYKLVSFNKLTIRLHCIFIKILYKLF